MQNPNDMGAMLQQALQSGAGRQRPQNTQQMDPMQQEVMEGEMPGMSNPVEEIQEQLDAVMAQMDITQDPMELQQLAGVARELQTALEAALQQDPAQGMGMSPMDFGGGGGDLGGY